MEKIKEGYQKTEMGVIPIDWEIKKIGDLAEIQTGSTPPTDNRLNYGDEYLFVSPADLGRSVYIKKTVKKLSKRGFEISRSFPKGSILFTCIGSTIGKTGIAFEALTSNQQINAVFPSEKLHYPFTYYILTFLSPRIRALAGEQAVPQINKSQFQSTLIFVPSLQEQKAIATALSDVDELIQSLDKLIAKKKAIKQGSMQRLLKSPAEGGQRLPGFSGEWEVKKLGEILNFYQLGGNYPNTEKETEYPLMKMGNIDRGNIDLQKIEYIPESCKRESKDILKYGDVLFNTRNTLDLVGKVAIWRDDLKVAYFNSNLMRLSFKSEYISSNFFVNYLLNTKKSLDSLRSIATGTTSVAAIYTRDLLKIEVSIPDLEEQKAIAQTLIDMDQEIEVLEQKREKYKALKQGMMQELLTGKKRLIN